MTFDEAYEQEWEALGRLADTYSTVRRLIDVEDDALGHDAIDDAHERLDAAKYAFIGAFFATVDALDAEDGEEFTSEDLHKHINDSIKAGKLTVMQAKLMQQEMKVARVRDLDTPAKVKEAKSIIDSFIKQNEG